jgi:hypothetical protein
MEWRCGHPSLSQVDILYSVYVISAMCAMAASDNGKEMFTLLLLPPLLPEEK